MAGVEGVARTIAELRSLRPDVDEAMAEAILAPAQEAATALRSTAPAQPLSHMPSFPVRVGVDPGRGMLTYRETDLVRVRLTGGGYTVASDIARSSVNSMVPNLNRKYGNASRWVWPTVERYRSKMESALSRAAAEVERKKTARMKG